MLAALLVHLALVSTLPPATDPPKTDAPADLRQQDLPEWSREDAASALATWRDAAQADPSAGARVAALRTLCAGRHPDLTKELVKLLKDKDPVVRREAAFLLGTQRGDKEAPKALLPLLKPAKRMDVELSAEAARSIGHLGIDKRSRKALHDLFWEQPDPKLRQGIVQALGVAKDEESFSLLVSLIDAPMPEDPTNPSNPPASYWRDKHEQWIAFKDDAIAALEAITGKRFVHSREALTWVEKEGKDRGIRYEKGRNPWL